MLLRPETTGNVCSRSGFIEFTHRNLFWRIRMKTKRWTLMAATGVTVLVSSMAFAAGGSSSTTVGTDTLGAKSTTNATVGADTSGTGGTTSGANAGTSAGTSGGTSAGVSAGSDLNATTPPAPAGGMSSSHMSTEGAANTNGANAVDRDKGAARAEDRAEVNGKSSTRTRTSTKHHKIAKPAASDASGS